MNQRQRKMASILILSGLTILIFASILLLNFHTIMVFFDGLSIAEWLVVLVIIVVVAFLLRIGLI